MRGVRSGAVPGPDPTHHLRHEDGHPHLTEGLWLAYSGTLYKQKLTDVREWIWNWHFVRLEIFLSPDDFLLPRAVLDVIFFLKLGSLVQYCYSLTDLGSPILIKVIIFINK